MALIPGTRVGVYEVTAQIGEGGMGQVFLAHDAKLNRDVALKILPDSFANDPDRLMRFTREAQTLAALNHPNIAHLHGLEESGGVHDKRSDLWAFGVVFLEMLTGRRVFTGPDAAHVLAAVLKSEPDWTTLPAETPAAVRRLLRRCLAKDRQRRLDSAAAARLEIEDALNPPSASEDPGPRPQPSPRSAWRRALPWAVAGIFGVALVSALLIWSPWRSTSGPATRVTLSLSRDNSLTARDGVVVSPDGRTFAFVARSSEGSRVYVRGLDEWEPHALTGTDGATLPFFSPDGRWIAFVRAGNLQKMPVSGGPAQIICTSGPWTGRWTNDATIIFGDYPKVGLWRVSPDGGTPQLIARPSEGAAVRYFWPEPLPADRGLLFTIYREGRTSIAVLARGTDAPRILVESGSQARYLPTGHLVYIEDNHLVAVPFDVDRLEIRGGATVVVDDINETGLTPYGHLG